MKPNYEQMSWKELRAYCLAHRDDLDPLEVFFARRSLDSEATWFSPPETQAEWEQQMEIIRPILEKSNPTD